MSLTLRFHYDGQKSQTKQPETARQGGILTLPPESSSQSLILSSLAAMDSHSFSVSPGATAAKTSMPFPMEDTVFLSTVTLADRTLCKITGMTQFHEKHEAEFGSRVPANLSSCLLSSLWLFLFVFLSRGIRLSAYATGSRRTTVPQQEKRA